MKYNDKKWFFLCLRIEQKKEIFVRSSKEFFRKISSNNFLVTSNKLRFYSNTERKRQYTGWVERFVILRLIQGNYRIYKEYTNPKDP